MKTQKQIRQDRAHMFLLRFFSGFFVFVFLFGPVFLMHSSKQGNVQNSETVHRSPPENRIMIPQVRLKKHVFLDVPANHPYKKAIDYGYEKGIMTGGKRGMNFKPYDFVSRAELVKIVSNLKFSQVELDSCMQRFSHGARTFYTFSDVPAESWFTSAVCIARERGITRGYPDGLFRPHQRISFSESAKILSKIFQFPEEKKPNDEWFSASVRVLENKNAIPKTIQSLHDSITRGDFMEMLYRILEEKTDLLSQNMADFSLHRAAPCQNCLVIPKLKIEVPIVYGAGANAFFQQDWRKFEREVLAALRGGVVHYPNTAKPGMVGNVFVSGHSSYVKNDPGKYNRIFAKLGELKNGDEYIIYSEGKKYLYKIYENKIIKPNDFSVLNPPTNKELSTLMTCWPVNTNQKRKIFVAERVM